MTQQGQQLKQQRRAQEGSLNWLYARMIFSDPGTWTNQETCLWLDAQILKITIFEAKGDAFICQNHPSLLGNLFLVGGFNPFEKYESKWESSPNRGENKKSLSCHPWIWTFWGWYLGVPRSWGVEESSLKNPESTDIWKAIVFQPLFFRGNMLSSHVGMPRIAFRCFPHWMNRKEVLF